MQAAAKQSLIVSSCKNGTMTSCAAPAELSSCFAFYFGLQCCTAALQEMPIASLLGQAGLCRGEGVREGLHKERPAQEVLSHMQGRNPVAVVRSERFCAHDMEPEPVGKVA